MRRGRLLLSGLLVLGIAPFTRAADEALVRRQWQVDGLAREALIYAPASARNAPAPVVFVFHGHGGTAQNAAEKFHIHDLWPAAISVYMQGIPTPAPLLDPNGERSGWQGVAGKFGDRDLHFFDAVLASLRQDYRVDNARVFATGHSNGGFFTYLLWAQRGDVFAALAPSAALAGGDTFQQLKPKPVFHCAGAQDNVVKFPLQRQLIERLITLNGCSPQGQKVGPRATRYASPDHDTPVIAYIHDGGHEMPDDESAAIVRFFKVRAALAANAPR